MVFKEDHVPCDAEMQALRRREAYDPTVQGEDSTVGEQEDEEDVPQKTRRNRNANPPEYLQKYQKQLAGGQFSKEAATKTQDDNRSYGFGKFGINKHDYFNIFISINYNSWT